MQEQRRLTPLRRRLSMGFQVVFYQLLLAQPNLGFIRSTFVFSGAIAWEAGFLSWLKELPRWRENLLLFGVKCQGGIGRA